jgi:hypothetical protein
LGGRFKLYLVFILPGNSLLLDAECVWIKKDGFYIKEEHGEATYCYEDLEEAKQICALDGSCGGIATQSNICEGKFRVAHGGPTFVYLPAWDQYNLYSFEQNCDGCKTTVLLCFVKRFLKFRREASTRTDVLSKIT